MALRRIFRGWLADDRGATAVEYGLICALMVVAAIGGMTQLSEANRATYDKLETEIAGAG
jgi:pilus assembly protein Flp/PilA